MPVFCCHENGIRQKRRQARLCLQDLEGDAECCSCLALSHIIATHNSVIKKSTVIYHFLTTLYYQCSTKLLWFYLVVGLMALQVTWLETKLWTETASKTVGGQFDNMGHSAEVISISSGVTGHSRQGQKRREAAEQGDRDVHLQWLKMACWAILFLHLTLWFEDLLPPPEGHAVLVTFIYSFIKSW